MIISPPWPEKYYPGPKIVCGYELKKIDSFHWLILNDEFSRIGSAGIISGISIGMAVGLPPILHYGSDYLKEQVVIPALRGDKFMSLAITEPHVGSDVANLKTTAVLSQDGSHYIVNGMKKWITNGTFCDFILTAVRTSDEGMFGISMLLIDAKSPGVSRRQMKCQGVWSSGTAFIIFDNVNVPVKQLVGEENQGFKIIMINFNFERLGICANILSLSRAFVSESFKFVHKRKTFGKRLVDHPVIRLKLG